MTRKRRLRDLFYLLEIFGEGATTIPAVEDLLPEYPPATIYRDVAALVELRWLESVGEVPPTKPGKPATIWSVTYAGQIMLAAWMNAEAYLSAIGRWA